MTTVMPQVNAAPGRDRRPARRAALGRVCAAVVCAAVVLVLYQFFVASGSGQQLDASGASSVTDDHGVLTAWGSTLLDLVTVPVLVGALVVAVLIALLRRRPASAVVAVALMALANVSTQALKHVLFDRPDLGITYDLANSFPSGHTTAATTLVAVFVLVTAPRWRPLVLVVGGAGAALAGWATLTNGWHRPSDVLAAFAVVAAWYFLARAVLLLVEDESARRR